MQRQRCHCWKWKYIAAYLGLLLLLGVLLFLGLLLGIWVHWSFRRDNSIDNTSKEGGHPGVDPGGTGKNSPPANANPKNSPPANANPIGIDPGAYPYIINETNKCPEGEPPPFLVLLILTEADQVEARDAIRQTWGNESLVLGLGVVRLFLLGGAKGGEQQEALRSESRQHHDILQRDFPDTYHNLAIKTMMGINWVAVHCPRASYVMKTDSDVLVNTEYLVRELLRPELKPRTRYFTSNVLRNARPFRDRRHKYYMPRWEYPGWTYPDYGKGMGYVFSGDVAAEVSRVSPNVPRLRFEDVYVGVCLQRLGIELTPQPRSLFHPWGLRYSSCAYSNMVAVHSFHPSGLLEYWHQMQRDKQHANCTADA